MIMKEPRAWMIQNVPKSGNVHLFADGRANESCEKYGLVESSTRMPYFSVGNDMDFLEMCQI